MADIVKLSRQITDLERKVLDMESHHDMNEVKKKRNEYYIMKRYINKGGTVTKKKLSDLKASHNLYGKHITWKKKLEKLTKELDKAIQDANRECENCNRKNQTGEYTGMAPYELKFTNLARNLLIKRRNFRFVEVDEYSDDPVLLCQECYSLFTEPGKSYANCWPSFVWNLLIDTDVLEVYGQLIWRMIPGRWRYWWIDTVKAIHTLNEVTINTPPSIFIDITSDIDDMRSGIKSNTLGNLMKCCNEHLIPSILFPWGESEYIHQCGKIPFDAFLQRFLPKCEILKISSDKVCGNIYSSREDYVRESV